MERWFPSCDGERRSSLIAERRGRQGESPRSHEPVHTPGRSRVTRAYIERPYSRRHLANAGADARIAESGADGELCLAILPYGKG
jgi:hypothetical protein